MKTDIIEDIESTKTLEFECLTERAQKFYLRQCQQYIDDGELRVGYLPKLAIWAASYDLGWKLRAEVAVEGETFQTVNRNGDTVMSANPKVKMMNDALKIADNILAEFGGSIKQARKIGKDKPTVNPIDEWNKRLQD